MNAEHYYQPMLRDVLEARGWLIRSVACPNLWCSEAWQLTSTWSPSGPLVHLLFEYDDHLCWVAATLNELHGQIDTLHLSRLYFKRGIERDIPQFLNDVDKLRMSAAAQK